MARDHSPEVHTRLAERPLTLRYTGALAAAVIALAVWFLWPEMHQDPFPVFIAAVVASARFFGFGPAVLCTATSALALDYFVLPPPGLYMGRHEIERLLVFALISILAAGLARQRSRAQTVAQQMRGRMAAIVESSEDAIFSTDENGIITSWNRGAERLYGYAASEAIGEDVSLLAPEGRVQEIQRNSAILSRGDAVESYRTERRRKDGGLVPIQLSISPLRDRKGAVIGSSAIARDITAQLRSDEALRRNEKLATAGRLAAAVAHEINNPLEAVTNLLYLARHDPTRRDEYLGLAEKEVQRVADIAQQTLGFVRERSEADSLDVAQALDQVLQLYVRKLDAKHIHVDKHYDAAVTIRGFEGELRQLFSNLILNAVDAMKDGGQLRLRVQRTHEWKNGRRPGVRVVVADNGSGIRSADRDHMFEPFFTTKGDIGTGLGLWLSQTIAQKHGGSIRFRSSVAGGHHGTVFSVFLPNLG